MTLRDPFVLPQIRRESIDDAAPPVKRIETGEDLHFFLTSQAYHDIKLWILQLTRACLPQTQSDGLIVTRRLRAETTLGPAVLSVQAILSHLDKLIDEIPPEAGPRRFGNAAFRTWISKVENVVDDLLQTLNLPSPSSVHTELRTYLLGSFGSAQRLDYGTGHELSYLAFLGILWKCAYFEHGEEWSIITGTLQPYLVLIRKLIKQYTLEPAGSHGVWGLDDHSFIPYILGSAQLTAPLPAQSDALQYPPMPVEGSLSHAPSPASITSARTVEVEAENNMYFAAVAFILDVKRGPFFEHSPYLYNISGIKDGWGKINKGMLKMYDAEVLGKFPVVQHFPFGTFWRWEKDPTAPDRSTISVHSQQQPVSSMQSQSTKAPWATQTPALGQPRSKAVHDRR